MVDEIIIFAKRYPKIKIQVILVGDSPFKRTLI